MQVAGKNPGRLETSLAHKGDEKKILLRKLDVLDSPLAEGPFKSKSGTEQGREGELVNRQGKTSRDQQLCWA